MKNKMVGIFICMLLIVTVIPVAGNIKEISKSNEIDNKIIPLADDKWVKTFGDIKLDSGFSVQQTSDGGYIIVGTTESYGAGKNDVWLIKTDSIGNKIWDKTFGGEGRDFGNSVQQTTDGGYIITGSTASYDNGKGDVLLLKTDVNGNMLWYKTFGYSMHDSGSEVKQTSDAGFIIIGDVNTDGGGSGDFWVIKTDNVGNLVWDKTFDGNGKPISHDYGNSIGLTSDNCYILTGVTFTTEDTNDYDIWLIKIDEYGNKLWDKKFGGTDCEFGSSVQQTNDGGYIITGVDSYNGISSDKVWLIKTDDSGNILWDKTFSGIQLARGNSVKQTSDDGYIIAGETFKGSRYNALLIKTDNNGEKEWSKTFGGVMPCIAFSVQQTTDGGYIITGDKGRLDTDVWLIKTDKDGNAPNSYNKDMIKQRMFSLFPDLFCFLERLPILQKLLNR
jgi:hypothetical protein